MKIWAVYISVSLTFTLAWLCSSPHLRSDSLHGRFSVANIFAPGYLFDGGFFVPVLSLWTVQCWIRILTHVKEPYVLRA